MGSAAPGAFDEAVGEPEADAALAQRWLDAGIAALVVSVEATRGSVPRNDGTRMLVSGERVAGTVGGGHLEWQAIARARQYLAERQATPPAWPVALGPSLGQCCGGTLTLRFDVLSPASVAAWPAPAPRFTLQLYGAGHVGRAIVRLLAQLPCQVRWVDERDDAFAGIALPAHIEAVGAEPLVDEVAAATPGAFHLVMTHRHDRDLALAEAILRRDDVGWFGMIGSATKRARFDHRLSARGIAPATLERMVCPIGLPGIAGKEPAVIAVSVVAQMLQQHKFSQKMF